MVALVRKVYRLQIYWFKYKYVRKGVVYIKADRKPSNITSEFLTGFRVKLYPTEEQKQIIDRNIQIARAIYNLGLEFQLKEYESTGKHIRFYDMITRFGNMRNHDSTYSWMKEVTNGTMREALANLENAFQKFFAKQNRFPKFKTRKSARKRGKKSVTVRSDRCKVHGEYLHISGIGTILAKNHRIPSGQRMYGTSVIFDGYDYWFGCSIEANPIDISDIPISEPVGIDVGLVNMIATSNGDLYKYTDNSKLFKRLKQKQKRLSKDYQKYYDQALSTRTKYDDIPKSKNHYKRLKKARDISRKITNRRLNDIHNATKHIVMQHPAAIVIEKISVMKQQRMNPHMTIPNEYRMFYEIHRQLKYKAAIRGIPVITAPEYYPSSQICSNCGSRNTSLGWYRKFRCHDCGYEEDRDINAAKNLRSLAYQNEYNSNLEG